MIKTKEELLKFLLNYYLDENKIKLMNLLDSNVTTQTALSKKARMSKPLISYQMSGNKTVDFGMLHMGIIKKVYDSIGTVIGYKLTKFGKEILEMLG